MRYITRIKYIVWLVIGTALLTNCKQNSHKNYQWEIIQANGEPTARHEAGLIGYKDKILLMGGRRINPTDVFDTNTNTWTARSPTPIELHHFQPVVVDDAIYIVGAMTGKWPNETPVERVIIYYPEKDMYEYGHEIPKHRRRGGAGVVYHNNKIYIVGGITHGHMDGYQAWFDEYDPKTGAWKVLPDAPDTRDHFQAVVSNNKLYAFAGRRTSKITNEDISLTKAYGNIFDFNTSQWESVTKDLKIPTERAGNAAFSWDNEIIIGGGESTTQKEAHDQVEVYNTSTKTWDTWAPLNHGRHGSGFAVVGDYVYIASGSGNRGGGPELTSLERLKLPSKSKKKNTKVETTQSLVYNQWHTITQSFKGPHTSENADDNPFLNYRLIVDYKHKDTAYTIQGFYAADGNASETSATEGNVWKSKFTPDRIGAWEYSATLYKADSIALTHNITKAEKIDITPEKGQFIVTTSDKGGKDFRAHGRLGLSKGYFKFDTSSKYWLKVGANSPENLLGYVDFDDTYRIQSSNKEGEASTTGEIHKYATHTNDWQTGDPTWKNGKGKSLIGAINYLASKEMNSVYFITMNILGDGKDVWPYVDPDDFTRFDVSKLAQWDIVFEHMQKKGILLHVVLQETENETLLDNGDTGPLRQLYFRELIARFGHHLGLIWNLGEENGPASWSPIAQNDRQRKAMAKFLKETDPYNHPVLLHTHAHDPIRKNVLDSIVGYPYVDGLSLQQNIREHAPDVVHTWKTKSKENNHGWLITMDEIGEWHTAAMTDAEDPYHDTLRQYVLWGTLFSGAAGVEWYFGAHHPHNDLTSEDWRQRDQLWELTKHAKSFFDTYLPYWEMYPDHDLINTKETYCFQKPNELYAIYLPEANNSKIDLSKVEGEFTVRWYDPLQGGTLQTGAVEQIIGGKVSSLGTPPQRDVDIKQRDWICLLKRMKKE